MRDADRRSAADQQCERASRLRDASQVEPPHSQLVATSTRRRPWRPAASGGPRSAFGTRIRDAKRIHATAGSIALQFPRILERASRLIALINFPALHHELHAMKSRDIARRIAV